jgi:hypothetical protein
VIVAEETQKAKGRCCLEYGDRGIGRQLAETYGGREVNLGIKDEPAAARRLREFRSRKMQNKGPAILMSTFALLMIVLAVANLPDITRYVKISRM